MNDKHKLIPDWSKIETIFLDMDGTLLDLHFDDFFWQIYLPEKYAEIQGIEQERARSSLQREFDIRKGTLNWYCTDFWSDHLGVDIITLKSEISHLINIHEHVIQFLETMNEHQKRVILLTNAHPDVVKLKMRHAPLEKYFNRIISSHNLGHPKEDQALWQQLQQEEPFNPATTLFIDDSTSVLDSARLYGIAYLLGISQPSSQKPASKQDNYLTLESFAQITPPTRSKKP